MCNVQTILVTGAAGQLGRLVVAALQRRSPASRVIALVRNEKGAASLAAIGVEARLADYADEAALERAFAGVNKALLISSSEIGSRVAQHRNVVEAAKNAQVDLLAYTSILHADASPLILAREHVETEALVRASGIPWVFLRNGWYAENHAGGAKAAVASGALVGAAGKGRISAAAREDYAEAAAAVLLSNDVQSGRIHELAGDDAFTLSDLAAEIARQSEKAIVYQNLQEADYAAALEAAGLPASFASVLADSDAQASRDALFDNGRTLRALIGRPTTSLSAVVRRALA